MASGQGQRKGLVILGAGVSGLTTALLLARKNEYNISVAAKHMPGDYDIEYASPWAGANYAPVSLANSKKAEWDRRTWIELERLTKETPQAGIHFQENRAYLREQDKSTSVGEWFEEMFKPEGPWFQDCVPNYRWLDKSSCPAGYDSGFGYTSVCINTAIYLPWLASECLKAGVTLKRASFNHIDEAFRASTTGQDVSVVVNCCGLGASTLGGVHDNHMIPIRGQTVLVRNSTGGLMVECSGTDDTGNDELVYIMERAAGGGTILGGCFQKHNSDPKVDDNLTDRILRRAAIACPALTGGRGPEAFDVVQARVGLRPGREGGTRVELEKLDDHRIVVHNYGHGGYGYQCSWGCSMDVVELVDKALGSQ